MVQSGYGLDILKYTETLETVSQASLPLEVLRGLGYWFFYGRDKIGQWIEPSVAYTQDLWLLARHATRCRSSHCSPRRSCAGSTAPSS